MLFAKRFVYVLKNREVPPGATPADPPSPIPTIEDFDWRTVLFQLQSELFA
jgi:hypothetical protein